MKQYRGYYIDHVIFNSTADIDLHIKNQLISRVKKFSKLLDNAGAHFSAEYAHGCMQEISNAEQKLHDEFGMSYEELEMLELEY